MNTQQDQQSLASITFVKGSLSGKKFQIVKPITTIGRQSDNDIVVPDQKVSRHHVRLVHDNGSWSIEKLSQSSPVTINQKSTEKEAIQHNSTIGIGEDTSFLFLLPIQYGQLESTQRLSPRPQPDQSAVPPPLSEIGMATVPVDQFMIAQNFVADSPPPARQLPGKTGRSSATEITPFSALGIPSLEVTDNTNGSSRMYPLASEIINVGRDSSNDIVINDTIISDLHLRIVRQDNQWVLIHPHPDRQQTLNGLLYHGRKIRGDKSYRKQLTRGDVFRIEDEHGTLVTLTYNDGSGAPQVMVPQIQPIQLNTAATTIGRLQDNDVVLHHPQVSAHHARLTQEEGTYRLTDLNSTNHTYVNGIHVDTLLLKPDDEIRIGPFKLIYTENELTQYDESESIRIDALGLKKVGNNQAILLNEISLSIPPRSFIALVGSSGTGKSTLLDALNGLRPAQQ
ncbi:MAG: FHA domain-containing protein, partial [Chloroflexota bacterium]|nr:FHA domain-containing protein [Chloroflexota bacterium]